MRNIPSILALYLKVALVAILLALFFRTFLVQVFRVPSMSMARGLLPGDHILVNKFIYGPRSDAFKPWLPSREIEPGEVVVFRFPPDPTQVFVKRCLAGPLDQAEIRSGSLFVNQVRIDESPYLSSSDTDSDFGLMTLPSERFFCLGDHRQASYDSRSWGLVPRPLVIAKALMVLWSVETAGERVQRSGFWGNMESIFSSSVAFVSRIRPERSLRVIR